MDTRKRLLALLIVPLFAGCISAQKTSGGTWSGQRDSQSSSAIATRPAGEIQADTMDGLLNVLTKVEASFAKFTTWIGSSEANFAKLTTHVESRVGKLENTVAKVDSKVQAALTIGGGGDSITSWINALVPWLSMSWLVYPLVWRPWRQRKERKRHGG
jgi:outer membrane murein-binding lipoprotein Lpp